MQILVRAIGASALSLGLCLALAGVAAAQEHGSFGEGPRFVAAVAGRPAPVEVEIRSVPALHQRISLTIEDASLKDALGTVERAAGVKFVYSPSVVNSTRRVTIRAENMTVAAVLTDLLVDAKVDVLLSGGGYLTLIPRVSSPPVPTAGTITGTVTAAETQEPVASAQVAVEGTGLGTLTNNDGEFSITDVPVGRHVVTVQSIGYRTVMREVDVADGVTVTVDFALEVLPTSLNELVVTVTGEQRLREVGNVVTRIRADSLVQRAPVMSFGDLLQGRAPGVLSLQESGGNTGQAGRLRIRGLNSALLSNDPIVVVDGVRVEAGAGTSAIIATSPNAGGATGRLADLNPDEIASIEIVKGPSATTLYGTDAANGVLVITTKRGEPGRTRWTAFTEQGLLSLGLDLTDNFPDAYYAFGRNTATNESQRCTLLQRAAGSCVADSLSLFNTWTDPDTRPLEDGYRQQYGLQVTGGTTGGATYFLSGEYEQETGTYAMPPADRAFLVGQRGTTALPDWQERPNAYERVNLRANLTAPLGGRGTVTLATGFVSNQNRQPTTVGRVTQVGYRDANDGWGFFFGDNPRPAYAFAAQRKDVVRRFLGSVAVSYGVRDWLTLRGTAGADLSTNAFGELVRRGEAAPGAFNATGERFVQDLAVARYSLDLGVTATYPFSSVVSSKTSLGVQYNRRAQRGSYAQALDLPLGGETLAGGTASSAAEATLTGTRVAPERRSPAGPGAQRGRHSDRRSEPEPAAPAGARHPRELADLSRD